MSFLEDATRIDRKFFAKYQRALLLIANSRLGRRFFGIVKHPKSRLFVEIAPNAVTWRADKGQMTTEFVPHNLYADRVRKVLKIIEALSMGGVLHFAEARAFALLPLFAGTTTTFNSSASAVSGFTRRTASGESFSTIRDSAGNGAGIGSVSIVPRWEGNSTDDLFNRMDRGHVMFDTAALTGATGVSANLELYHTTKDTPTETDAGLRAVHIAASSAASPTALVNADYAAVASTSFGSIAFASFTGSAYNVFTLDSNGVANINLTGISKFSVRSGADITNVAPSTSGSGDSYAVRFQNHTDANPPKLVVTYTPAPVATTITKSMQYCVKTTPATITKGLEYVVTNIVSVTLTKSMQYCVKAPSTAITKSLQYCVKTTPSAIEKSLQYAVKTALTITKALQYVINFVPEDIGGTRGVARRTGLNDGTAAPSNRGKKGSTGSLTGTKR